MKKLEEYAFVLEKQAQSAESQGNVNEAAKLYVKLIDVFLLLAREAPDHPTWARYASRAEALQKRTKELISNSENPSGSKAGAFKKIFGMKSSEEKQEPIVPSKLTENQKTIPHAPEEMVPKRMYDQLLEKTRELESRAHSITDRSEYDKLEARCRELEEKLANYRSNYEEAKLIVSNSVPRSQYDELQKAFVNMVPKDTYNAAQARISELESQLENSIPRTVLDNLANEVSFLVVTASIPIEPEVESPTIPISNHALPPLNQKHGAIAEELLEMKQRIDLLELKVRSSRESLNA